MTSSEYESIKQTITSATDKMSKAEGANERILQQLKNDYELKSIEKAEAFIESETEEVSALIKERNEVLAELESAVDWNYL